jgi:two-component system sensor histidine kinase HydH
MYKIVQPVSLVSILLVNNSMINTKNKKSWIALPPWIVIGAVVILAPIFIFWATENIHRQQENTTKLLLEKGAALIRSFEAGTRTGMLGMRWGGSQVQRLLRETAQQPDIVYLLITDTDGNILAHSDSSQIGGHHGTDLDLDRISRSTEVEWRKVTDANNRNIFEVFRQFSPTHKHPPMHFDRMIHNDWFRSRMMHEEGKPPPRLSIFVGLDMEAVDAAAKEDMHHTVLMAVILLLIGFTGIMSLFLAQGYRSARTSLSKVKAFSDSLVENMPIGLLAIDSEGTITSSNQTAEFVLQLSPHEIIGKKAVHILPVQLMELIKELKLNNGIIEKEIDFPSKDGKRIPLEVITTVLKDEDGTFLEQVILFRDLTEIRRLRQEIDRSFRLASLGRLAAGIAHEIRNPLSSIKGFATYFRERYHDIPEDRKTADIMIQEVERLNRVIGQLLEFARPMNIRLRPTSLQAFLRRSLKMIENQAREKNIAISLDTTPDNEDIMIDPDRMSQVLLNLYLNAIEAMDNGGTLSITLTREDPGQTVIGISDTGNGIEKKDMGKIFDPYFTTKPSGTGLGLAIVHRIVEAHHGEVTVKSDPSIGTIVSIVLPANAGEADNTDEDFSYES